MAQAAKRSKCCRCIESAYSARAWISCYALGCGQTPHTGQSAGTDTTVKRLCARSPAALHQCLHSHHTMALHRALRGLLQDLRLVAGTPSGDLSARSPHIALIRSAQQCQCCAGHSIRHQSTEAAGPSAQADSISLQSQASPSARRGPSEPLGVQQGSAPGSYIPRLTAMPGKYTTGRSVSEYIPWVFSRHQTPLRHVARRVQFFKQALEQEQVCARQCRPHLGGQQLHKRGINSIGTPPKTNVCERARVLAGVPCAARQTYRQVYPWRYHRSTYARA